MEDSAATKVCSVCKTEKILSKYQELKARCNVCTKKQGLVTKIKFESFDKILKYMVDIFRKLGGNVFDLMRCKRVNKQMNIAIYNFKFQHLSIVSFNREHLKQPFYVATTKSGD
jgi:hypothetical protein